MAQAHGIAASRGLVIGNICTGLRQSHFSQQQYITRRTVIRQKAAMAEAGRRMPAASSRDLTTELSRKFALYEDPLFAQSDSEDEDTLVPESTQAASASEKFTPLKVLEKILAADFCLLTLALFWFLTGEFQQSLATDDAVIAAFCKLWDPLFLPAIAIFTVSLTLQAILIKM